MLAYRVIPTLLVKNRQLVKGKRFVNDRVIGNPIQAAEVHFSRSVDELCILDVGGGSADLEYMRQIIDHCWSDRSAGGCPITVGGGIRCLDDAMALRLAGADKFCVRDGSAIMAIAGRFGSQAVVACLNFREGLDQNVVPLAEMMVNAGAGEILLQDVEREGTRVGYNLSVIARVARAVDVPVIASSGCSGYQNMVEAIRAGASAVAAGALFAFTEATPKGAAQYLQENGLEARI